MRHKVAARNKAAKCVQVQTPATFHFDYRAATRKLCSWYRNLRATDLVAEGVGALFVSGSGLATTLPARSWGTPSASGAIGCASPRWQRW